MMKVKTCPQCGQEFSITAAGLELLYRHLIQEHQLTAEAAGDAVDLATIEDRPEILPVPLPAAAESRPRQLRAAAQHDPNRG